MRIAILITLLFSVSSFAQTAPSKTILETALSQSKSDLNESTRLLNIEIAKGEGFDACKANELLAKQEYSQWFVDHSNDFRQLSTKVDSVVSSMNEKMKLLKSETIRTNPVSGQDGSEVEISFEKLTEYFNLFNGRLKTCSADSKNEVVAQMENPKLNSLHVTHSQVVAAMEKITTNLNAALKEPDLSYSLTFAKEECGYSLNFKASFLMNDVRREFGVSLVDPKVAGSTSLKVGDSDKWAMILGSGIQIDGQTLDSIQRFKTAQDKNKGTCSILAKVVDSLKSTSAAKKPYVSYAEIDLTIAQIKATEAKRVKEELEKQQAAYNRFHTLLSKEKITDTSVKALTAMVSKFSPKSYFFINYKHCELLGGYGGDTVSDGLLKYEFYLNNKVIASVKDLRTFSGSFEVVKSFKDAVISGQCE